MVQQQIAQLGEERFLALVERSREIKKWKPWELIELRSQLSEACSQVSEGSI